MRLTVQRLTVEKFFFGMKTHCPAVCFILNISKPPWTTIYLFRLLTAAPNRPYRVPDPWKAAPNRTVLFTNSANRTAPHRTERRPLKLSRIVCTEIQRQTSVPGILCRLFTYIVYMQAAVSSPVMVWNRARITAFQGSWRFLYGSM